MHDRCPSTRRPSRHQDSLHGVIDVLGVHSGVRERPIYYLDKAAAFASSKKIDPSVLVSWRLAPDMFALARQVQVVPAKGRHQESRDYLRLISPHPLTVLFSGDAMRSSLAWGKNEMTRIHHITRGRCGRVAALLARATDSIANSRVRPSWVDTGRNS